MEKELTFEQAMKRLEEIVNALENGSVSLDDSLKLFEEGIKLSKYCENELKNIENKASKILEDSKEKTFEE
jgi:exodeoxyribonuclease VII small subunit